MPVSIEGHDLTRNAFSIPQDLPPGPCVLLFAFSPGHQSEAMSWAETLRDIVTSGAADARQVIVLPTFAKLGERLVVDQLSKTIPAEAHSATVIAFADPGATAKAAGGDTNHIVLCLLDGARNVVWSASGAHTSDLEAALRAKIGASSS